MAKKYVFPWNNTTSSHALCLKHPLGYVQQERAEKEKIDSQADTGQLGPLKHFPAGCTNTEFDLHSVYIMISLAAAVKGDYAGWYQQNSFSSEVGMSSTFSRGLQVDGEQERVQSRATEEEKETAVYWCYVHFAWKNWLTQL